MIRGGQGRTSRQVAEAATGIVIVGCLAFIFGGVLALAAWIRT